MDYVSRGKEAASAGQQQFGSELEKSTVRPNESLYQQVQKDPVSVAQNQDLTKEFKTLRDTRYQGPQSFVDSDLYQSTYGGVKKGTDTAQTVQSEAGKKAFLEQEYTRPGYTGGQKKLDTYLIQADKGARPAFENVGQQGQQLGSSFQDLTNLLNQQATQAKQTTESARSGARNALGIDDTNQFLDTSRPVQLQRETEARAAEANAKAAAERQQLMQDLAYKDVETSPYSDRDINLSSDQMRKLGVAPGTQTYGLNLADYLQQAPGATRHTVAGKEEQAQLDALAALADQQNTFLPYSDQAGTYDPRQANTFDADRFGQQLVGKKAEYQDALKGWLEKVPFYGNTTGDIMLGAGNTAINRNTLSQMPLTEAIKFMEPYIKEAQGVTDPAHLLYQNSRISKQAYKDMLNILEKVQQQKGFYDTIGARKPSGGIYDFYEIRNALEQGTVSPIKKRSAS